MKHLVCRSTMAAVGLLASGFSPAAAAADAPPTFTRDIAPIFYKNCVVCHRAGEVAPMSLLSYETSRPWAKSIKKKVVSREMPPWFADPTFGHFSNDRSLTAREI